MMSRWCVVGFLCFFLFRISDAGASLEAGHLRSDEDEEVELVLDDLQAQQFHSEDVLTQFLNLNSIRKMLEPFGIQFVYQLHQDEGSGEEFAVVSGWKIPSSKLKMAPVLELKIEKAIAIATNFISLYKNDYIVSLEGDYSLRISFARPRESDMALASFRNLKFAESVLPVLAGMQEILKKKAEEAKAQKRESRVCCRTCF